MLICLNLDAAPADSEGPAVIPSSLRPFHQIGWEQSPSLGHQHSLEPVSLLVAHHIAVTLLLNPSCLLDHKFYEGEVHIFVSFKFINVQFLPHRGAQLY